MLFVSSSVFADVGYSIDIEWVGNGWVGKCVVANGSVAMVLIVLVHT